MVRAYGENEPAFGGLYFDGEVLVALFTTDLDDHADHIRPLLRAPEKFRVHKSERPWRELEAANVRISSRLATLRDQFPEITNYGIGLCEGQFAVQIGVEQLTPELAGALTEALAPEQVQVVPGIRAHRA